MNRVNTAAMKITAFLPCAGGIDPASDEHRRGFAGRAGGLLELKIEQLLEVRALAAIVVSTPDQAVVDIVRGFDDPRLKLHRRAEDGPAFDTGDAAWIPLVLRLIPSGHVLWTRCSMPFFGSELYAEAIETYAAALEVWHDSLMAVTPQTRPLWGHDGPLNLRVTGRTLRPQVPDAAFFQVNGGLFLQSVEGLRRHNTCMGRSPWLFETSEVAAFEVGAAEDLTVAQALVAAGYSVR